MRTPLRTAARGLMWVNFGVAVLVMFWLCLVAAAFDMISMPYSARHVFYAVIAIGLGLPFAGRCFAPAVPPDARAARAWGWLAVLLDGCGLFSTATNFVLAQSGILFGPGVELAAVLFGLGGLLLGRVAYMFHLRAVARYVGDEPLALRALIGFWHAVAVAGTITLGTWWLSQTMSNRSVVQIWLLLITLGVLHWTWRYVRLLSAAGEVFRAYNPPPPDIADDPDRVYRERYEMRQAEGRADKEYE